LTRTVPIVAQCSQHIDSNKIYTLFPYPFINLQVITMAVPKNLVFDEQNKVLWPQDSLCPRQLDLGCSGFSSWSQLVTHPATECWFCAEQGITTSFLEKHEQALIYNAQPRLIALAGGIFSEDFKKSRLQKQAIRALTGGADKSGSSKAGAQKGGGGLGTFGNKGKGKEKQNFGKDKAKGTGKDFAKGKGKDKDRGKAKAPPDFFGQALPNQPSVGQWLQQGMEAEIATAAAASGGPCAEATGGQMSTPSSTASRKSCGSGIDPREELSPMDKLRTLLNNTADENIKVDDLRKGLGIEGAPKAPATLCGENHQHTSEVAKALKVREQKCVELAEAQTVLDNLKEKVDSDSRELRRQYDQKKDEINKTFDTESNAARHKRNNIATELDMAEKNLGTAQKQYLEFFVASSTTKVPNSLSKIVNSMEVDTPKGEGEGHAKEVEKGDSPTRSPTPSDERPTGGQRWRIHRANR